MPPSPPLTVYASAGLLAAYGATILLQAVWGQVVTGWEDTSGFGRALIRCVAFAALAYGVRTTRGWAWWAGLGASCLFGLGTLATLWLFGAAVATNPERAPDLPVRFFVFSGLCVLELFGAAVLLLTPSARAAFRKPV